MESFLEKIELRSFKDDHGKAVSCFNFLEKFLADTEWLELSIISNKLNNFCALLKATSPLDTIPRNIAHRILKIINDEYYSVHKRNDQTEKEHMEIIKLNVLDVLQEHKAEYEQCQELISNLGENMFHSNETILTSGYCPFTLEFLLKGAKRRRVHVIVVECTINEQSGKMAKELVEAGIQTTLIEDHAVFAFMSPVNKVILGCDTVFLDGGMRTLVGGSNICLAAHHYAIPVYACAATYKFSVLKLEETVDYISSGNMDSRKNNGVGPVHDIVDSQYIESYITNEGMIAPRHVYRQLKKLYFPQTRNIYEKAVYFRDS